MDPRTIDTLSGDSLKSALQWYSAYLPQGSDRRSAQSLAYWPRDYTPAQEHFARNLLRRALRFSASGVKGDEVESVGDIFSRDAPRVTRIELNEREKDLVASGSIIEAIKAVQERTACWLSEAKDAVEVYQSSLHQPSSGTPSTLAVLDESKLEPIVRKVVEPGLSRIAETISRDAQSRQDAFNRGAAQTIAQQVVTRVLDEMEKRKPREVLIRVTRGEVTRIASGKAHKQFEHLVRAASLRLANGYAPGIFLAGEAGSGKTTGTKMLAEVLGLEWHFNGAISFPHEMLGFIDAGGKYHSTPFRCAYEHGGVYTFDEVDRSDSVALLAVNPHLANGLATFPDGQVKRHPNCIIVGTANTWGHGADAQYSGATKLDAAFLSRFPIRISWDIDPDLEESIVPHREWLARVRSAREKARAAGLKIMIDTRHALAGVGLIAAGYSLDEASAMTYLAGLKPDQRSILS